MFRIVKDKITTRVVICASLVQNYCPELLCKALRIGTISLPDVQRLPIEFKSQAWRWPPPFPVFVSLQILEKRMDCDFFLQNYIQLKGFHYHLHGNDQKCKKNPSGKVEKELNRPKNPILGDFKQYKRGKVADTGRKQFSAKVQQMTMSLLLGKHCNNCKWPLSECQPWFEFLNLSGIVSGVI